MLGRLAAEHDAHEAYRVVLELRCRERDETDRAHLPKHRFAESVQRAIEAELHCFECARRRAQDVADLTDELPPGRRLDQVFGRVVELRAPQVGQRRRTLAIELARLADAYQQRRLRVRRDELLELLEL